MPDPAQGAVLIGSGPSLNRIDPRRLAGYDTIAFNRSWVAWPNWGFAPAYHACLDPASMAIIGPDLAPVVARHRDTRFFFHGSAAGFGIEASDRVSLCDLVPGSSFGTSLSALTDYGNVGSISMQVLYLLGYRKVLMVGVDGDYLPETDVSRDHNHFRPDYATGRVPLTPELRVRYTAGWPAVAAECERLALQVRNASPGTVLTCFETADLTEGLAWIARNPVSAVNT